MKSKLFFFFAIAMFSAAAGAVAQENNAREVGIRFTGLDNFNIIYKKQKAETKYLRIRLAEASISYENTAGGGDFDLGLGLGVGIENRSPLAEKVHFITGAELIASIDLGLASNYTSFGFKPGIGIVIGAQYDITEKFYASVETIPALMLELQANSGNNRALDKFGINAGFNNLAAVTLAYRF